MIVMIVEVNGVTHERWLRLRLRKDDFGVEVDVRVLEEGVVPNVEEVSLVDGVFDGAFGGDGEEEVVIGEGVVVSIFITRDVEKELSRWNEI
ncbi:hypothetical protein Tco_1047471, partial [Tanacetum coccineum]